MLANDFNYEEEKISIDETDKVEHQNVKEEKVGKQKAEKRNLRNEEKERPIFNMKAIAKKVFPPGCAPIESSDEEED